MEWVETGSSKSPAASGSIAELQARATPYFLGVLWLHVVIVAGVGLAFGDVIGPTVAAFLICALPTATWKICGAAAPTRYAMAASFAGLVGLIVFQFAGHPWQIDVHMYFFAALAMIAVLCDWRTIIVGAGVIAVHHLTLNFVMPAAVFPNGADFYRVVLHAVIVVVETGFLIALTLRIARALSAADGAIARATDAEAKALESARKQSEAEAVAEVARSRERADLADRFQAEVGAIVELVAKAAADLQAASQEMAGAVESTREECDTAASDANVTAGSAQTVATSTEDLSQGARDVASQVATAAERLRATASGADDAEARVAELLKALGLVDEIVLQIGDVAEQTNLLALNATIEAARAGEAGKGFAVVATEVKSLANETRKMTERIAAQLGAVQQASNAAVEATRGIVGEIATLDETTGAIAAAVAQQSEAATTISGSARQAADGADEVLKRLEAARSGTHTTVGSAARVGTAATDLSGHASALQTAMKSLLDKVRAA